MELTKVANGDQLKVSINGRLDTSTAVEAEAFFNENLAGVKSLIIDCENLSYISSAGLRVLLSIQKKMNSGLKLVNVQELVMEVFEMTGFSDILAIE